MQLELDIQEVNFILETLMQQPYRTVAGLVQKVQMQATMQMQTAAPVEPKGAAAVAAETSAGGTD